MCAWSHLLTAQLERHSDPEVPDLSARAAKSLSLRLALSIQFLIWLSFRPVSLVIAILCSSWGYGLLRWVSYHSFSTRLTPSGKLCPLRLNAGSTDGSVLAPIPSFGLGRSWALLGSFIFALFVGAVPACENLEPLGRLGLSGLPSGGRSVFLFLLGAGSSSSATSGCLSRLSLLRGEGAVENWFMAGVGAPVHSCCVLDMGCVACVSGFASSSNSVDDEASSVCKPNIGDADLDTKSSPQFCSCTSPWLCNSSITELSTKGFGVGRHPPEEVSYPKSARGSGLGGCRRLSSQVTLTPF